MKKDSIEAEDISEPYDHLMNTIIWIYNNTTIDGKINIFYSLFEFLVMLAEKEHKQKILDLRDEIFKELDKEEQKGE